MVEPITGKLGKKAVTQASQATAGSQQTQKMGPSKFDQVQMKGQQTLKIPDEVTRVPAAKLPEMQQQLVQRVRETDMKTGEEFFRKDLDDARSRIADLDRRVSGVPETPVSEKVKQRLLSIEQQFNEASRLARSTPQINDLNELLQVQQKMYLMNQNVQIMSKVVDQLSSGIKTVLRTQV